MNRVLHHWVKMINRDIRLFLWIGLGVFLFILFFQPFPLENFDFNNRLLFVAGLGAIVFLVLVVVRSIFPSEGRGQATDNTLHHVPALLSSIIMVVMISLMFAFYIRYVGGVSITFFIMFRVVTIAVIPPVAVVLQDKFQWLTEHNAILLNDFQSNQKKMADLKEDYLNKRIVFASETGTDDLQLMLSEVVIIKSANNYVEVVFREGDRFEKKLLRNTLKTIEHQLLPYSSFIRCHRVCIVNSYHIQRIENKNQNYWLSILGYDEQIPVSRQYLLKVRERLQGSVANGIGQQPPDSIPF